MRKRFQFALHQALYRLRWLIPALTALALVGSLQGASVLPVISFGAPAAQVRMQAVLTATPRLDRAERHAQSPASGTDAALAPHTAQVPPLLRCTTAPSPQQARLPAFARPPVRPASQAPPTTI